MKLLAAILLVFLSSQAFTQLKTSASKPGFPVTPNLTDSVYVKTNKPGSILQPYSPPGKMVQRPVWRVDSVVIAGNCLTYLDPNEIENIDVRKDSKYPEGIIDVKLKDHKLLLKILQAKLLSLNDIKKTYVVDSESNKTMLFVLNDKLLTDTANVRIPDVCIEKIVIAKASELPYFKMALPHVLLMMISTKFMSTQTAQPEIRIRGLASSIN